MSPEPDRPGPDAGRYSRLLDFVEARFWSLVSLGALIAAVMLYLGASVDIPRPWKIGLAAAVFALPVSWWTGKTVVSWLYDPRWFYVIDIDACEEKGALYRFPESEFRDLEVLDGNLDRLAPSLYVGKRVDRENGRVAGTWRGTLTDRELLLSLRKVRECRGRLESDARRGFVLDSSAFVIVRRAVHETTKHVINTFEKGTLPDDGEALGVAIDEELDEFGVRDRLDETIEDLAEKRLESVESGDDERPDFEFVSDPAEPDERARNGSAEAVEVKP
ncbi:hypothetical protein ACOJIV_22725 [Haloarcula sp. AONF1]